MSTLDFTILDLDFPAGSKNKTATLVTGDREALLVDAAFTRADGHRLAAAVLDSGKTLTAVFISHGDPDFYFGAEVLADAFPDAVFLATPLVIEHIQHSYAGKLKAWEALGANLPTRLVELTPLAGDLVLEGHLFELRGGPAELPDRHYLWQPEHRAVLGGVLLFAREHVWVADTPEPQAARRLGHAAGRDGRPGARTGRARAPAARRPRRRHRHHRHPRLPHRLRDRARRRRRRRGADRGARRTLPRPRHADRRADRREGRQGRDELGMTAMNAPISGFAASPAPANVVRRQYLASAAGDLEALRATLAPDVEWTEMAGFPLAGTYRTPSGVTSGVMERLARDWDDWTAHDDTYITDGENVVVLARYTAVNKTTGKEINVRVAHHFIVRGGQIVRFEQFTDTAKVRDAMSTGA